MRYRFPVALALVLAVVFRTAVGASLNEQLFTAASDGNAEAIATLHAAGADPNSRDNDGFAPLRFAVWNGHAEAIAALLAIGADPNARNNDGFTALHTAAQHGHSEAIAALHAASADPNARSNDELVPLHLAAWNGHAEAIGALHAAGADPNTRLKGGFTALHVAAQHGHAEAIAALHAAGADSNARSNDGFVPLHLAAQNGHAEAIAVLLEARADPNARSNDGFVPLQSAARNGHTEAIVALLAVGADPNARSNDGFTAVHVAAEKGHTEAIAALHETGAALNTQNDDGHTPLDLAAQRGHAEAIAVLHAVPVPEEAAGIWSESECGGSGDMYLVNASHAMIVRSSEGKFALAIVPAEWAGGAVVLTQADGVAVLQTASLKRCRALPALAYVGFGEVITLFQAYDGIRALCEADAPLSCAGAAFAMIDISEDGRLSEAELARVIRASGVLLTYAILAEERRTKPVEDGWPASFVPAGKLFGTMAVTVFGGPLLIGNLVRSYDYDGDGFLSLEEIMQDRLPEDMAGIAENLAEAGIAEAGTTMMRNVPNLIGTLEVLLRGAF